MSAAPVDKSQAELIAEWDRLASLRHRQIVSGLDATFSHVLMPAVVAMAAPELDGGVILDVGCGTGELSSVLSKRASSVVGVDPSPVSIEIASAGRAENCRFVNLTIVDFARSCTTAFDLAIANMVLMDCLDLVGAIKAVASVLRPGAILVSTVTHPCFWPEYWGYKCERWFDYSREIQIEAPFKISAERSAILSTHVHRPLHSYFDAITQSGFTIERIVEPMPGPNWQGQAWAFPRYLGFRARRLEGR